MLARSSAEKEISFELTDEGGRAWESAARPQWHRLTGGSAVSSEEDNPNCMDWTRFSHDRERLMSVLGWYPVVQGEPVGIRTIN